MTPSDAEQDPVVFLRRFANEPDASVARAILEANGIPSIMSTDGASGIEPPLTFMRGARLSVRTSDLDAAQELLGPEEG